MSLQNDFDTNITKLSTPSEYSEINQSIPIARIPDTYYSSETPCPNVSDEDNIILSQLKSGTHSLVDKRLHKVRSTELGRLRLDVIAKDAQIVTLTANNTAKDAQIVTLTANNTAKDAQIVTLTAAAARIPALEHDVTRLTADVVRITADNGAKDTRILALEHDVARLTEELRLANERIVAIGADNTAKDAEVVRLIEELRTANERIRVLNADVARITADNTAKDVQIARIPALEQENRDKDARIGALEKENRDKDARIGVLEQENRDKDARILADNGAKDARIGVLEQENRDKDAQILADNEAKDAQIAILEKEVERIAILEKEVKERERDNADLIADNRKLIQEKKTIESQHANELQKENDTIKKENDAIKKENDAIKKENDAIKKENDIIKKENEKLKEENINYKAYEARITDSINALSLDNKRLNDNTNSYHVQLDVMAGIILYAFDVIRSNNKKFQIEYDTMLKLIAEHNEFFIEKIWVENSIDLSRILPNVEKICRNIAAHTNYIYLQHNSLNIAKIFQEDIITVEKKIKNTKETLQTLNSTKSQTNQSNADIHIKHYEKSYEMLIKILSDMNFIKNSTYKDDNLIESLHKQIEEYYKLNTNFLKNPQILAFHTGINLSSNAAQKLSQVNNDASLSSQDKQELENFGEASSPSQPIIIAQKAITNLSAVSKPNQPNNPYSKEVNEDDLNDMEDDPNSPRAGPTLGGNELFYKEVLVWCMILIIIVLLYYLLYVKKNNPLRACLINIGDNYNDRQITDYS